MSDPALLVRCAECHADPGDKCRTPTGRMTDRSHRVRGSDLLKIYGRQYIMRVRVRAQVHLVEERHVRGLSEGDLLIVSGLAGLTTYRRIICRESDGAGPDTLGDFEGDVHIGHVEPVAFIAQVDGS